MIGKLIIVLIIGGGIIFLASSTNIGSNIITNLIDNENTKLNISELETQTEIESEILDDAEVLEEEKHVGQVIEKTNDDCLISIPDKARIVNGKTELTYVIPLDDCEYDVNEFVEVTFGGAIEDEVSDTQESEPNSDPGTTNVPTNPPQVTKTPQGTRITVTSLPKDLSFETLSLKSSRDGYDVTLRYEDSSDSTISVYVTLKNSDEEIFSGIFKSSKFETTVKDVSEDTPHIIEMIIEHEVHGTIHSSVFNPVGSQQNEITGVFVEE